ncbi:helix-turn-helix domain-containing protein [Nitratireductor alexandrii]|uniref:helix-turn-helix domain-containing protein n=1 Tax=Nitratireductor alexandrii TaxID=2448161 RepID=UPI001EE7F63F|nr:helix-turn-helix domain-containing protein [Nitratireductor alexandrii]
MKVAGNRGAFFRMTRTKRLTETERAEIVREAADGVSTSELAERFGVTARAVRYTLKADADRQRDAAVATAAVTVKLTPEELEALDEVLAAAGIETRTEGVRRLIQAAGGTFVPDAQLAAEMARYRASLHEVGNGVVQIAKQMVKANRAEQGEGAGASAELSELRLAQMRGLARFILDSADEIDLLLRRRRDGMQLSATAALREFAHAAE